MLMVLGVWVMVLFTLGFPANIKQILAVVTGVLIVVIAYRIKPDSATHRSDPSSLPYAEHRNE